TRRIVCERHGTPLRHHGRDDDRRRHPLPGATTARHRAATARDVTRAFARQVVTAAHEDATAAITATYEPYPDWMKE
ncbi:MAG TPA: hypothetical protein VNM91_05010, partial [Dehalococcoidia bacterium]|nr:hypothetical protein [Dehalococcoidia bacterium]